MNENKEHIVIMLVRQLIEQYSKCGENAYYGGNSLVKYSPSLEDKPGSLINNPFFESYIKKLHIIKEYDLIYQSFNRSLLYNILDSCGILPETFNNVMYSVILDSIKSSLKESNEWLQFSYFEQYLKQPIIEIVEEVYDIPPSYYVVARGEIDNRPLVAIFDDYTFNDIDLKIKTSEEILKYMTPTIDEQICSGGICSHTKDLINNLKKYRGNRINKIKKL